MMWVTVANTNSCRIFSYEKKPSKLTLMEELNHPQSKLKDVDLVADGPGHYSTWGSIRGAYAPRETPHNNEIDFFARTVANALNKGKREQVYNNLILIAQPHMLGLITGHLEDQTHQSVSKKINKDFTNLNEKDLLEMLSDYIVRKKL